jgi:hypothetical protein
MPAIMPGDECTRTIRPTRALTAQTLTLKRSLSDLVNQSYGLVPAEIELMWKTALHARTGAIIACAAGSIVAPRPCSGSGRS